MIDRHQSTDHCIADHGKNGSANACVDVLIAARDRADTIERAISSALGQSEVRVVIVVDDGSTDDTAARASRCDPEGKRVIIERLESSVGPSAARNIAIEISVAPWLAVLDADDFFLPGRIGPLLSRSDDCDLVADGLLQVSEHSAVSASPPPLALDLITQTRRLTLEEFALGNVTRRGLHRKELGYLKPLLSRQFLDRHGLRYDPSLRLGEDCMLYARALAAGARFLLIPAAGYVAVERTDSLSARHDRRDLEKFGDGVADLLAMGHLASREREALAKLHWDLQCRAQWLILVEAVKSHNLSEFASAFFCSPAMTPYIMRRLLDEAPRQIWKRSGLRYNW